MSPEQPRSVFFGFTGPIPRSRVPVESTSSTVTNTSQDHKHVNKGPDTQLGPTH